MKILGIDTSGNVASVAICDETGCLGSNSVVTKLTHSQVMMPMMEKLLQDCNLKLDDIDVFAVANGPGSYTGLRIGISAVKAMCFAINKKCIGISTLEALAYNCVASKSRIVSMMRARPGIVYFGAFESDGNKLTRLCDDKICDTSEAVKYLESTCADTILTGDYAKTFYEENCEGLEGIRLAPKNLLLQSAASICNAAFDINNYYKPDNLDVSYLQITKAEKELIQKGETNDSNRK